MKENFSHLPKEKIFEHPTDGLCFELPDYSYYSSCYLETDQEEGLSSNYTYTREPVPGETTVYADSPCGYVVLRDDVFVSVASDSVSIEWDMYEECPIK